MRSNVTSTSPVRSCAPRVAWGWPASPASESCPARARTRRTRCLPRGRAPPQARSARKASPCAARVAAARAVAGSPARTAAGSPARTAAGSPVHTAAVAAVSGTRAVRPGRTAAGRTEPATRARRTAEPASRGCPGPVAAARDRSRRGWSRLLLARRRHHCHRTTSQDRSRPQAGRVNDGWVNSYIVEFGAGSAAKTISLLRGGGKAVNLVRLAGRGFPVPPGFVCTTDAYRAVVTANSLDGVIEAALHGLHGTDPAALEGASSLIRAAFEATEVPELIATAIREAHATLGDGPVAVRSSATAEDLADASFAGQQDTYLNVVGTDAVLDAVTRCWGSLWTARAIGYRTQAGIAHDDVALAVVVQRQIASDASGVAFTADPLTGARNRVVIDATLGLGEALVSGQVVPDHVVCSHSGEVLQKVRGEKAVVTVPVTGGGIETHERTGEEWSLDDEHFSGVARLAVEVEQEYGAPQDIEWAVADGRLWLLQARAITSLYGLPQDIDTPDELGLWGSFGTRGRS